LKQIISINRGHVGHGYASETGMTGVTGNERRLHEKITQMKKHWKFGLQNRQRYNI